MNLHFAASGCKPFISQIMSVYALPYGSAPVHSTKLPQMI